MDVALVMKSAQIGASAAPPVIPRSRLSSKPIQITHSRLEVKPANQPSREVPVFPAAGRVNPCARTAAPVPRFSTRSEEHTSELSHQIISYAVFCLKKKKKIEDKKQYQAI